MGTVVTIDPLAISEKRPLRKKLRTSKEKEFEWQEIKDVTSDRYVTPTKDFPCGKGSIDMCDGDFSTFGFFKKVIQWDNLLTNIILAESQLYMLNKMGKFSKLSKEELNAFYGVELFSGYHRLPQTRHYWSKSADLHTYRSLLKSLISRTRLLLFFFRDSKPLLRFG